MPVKLIRFLRPLLFVCLLPVICQHARSQGTAASPQHEQYSIPFGSNGRITIDLESGRYNLAWNEFTYITGAYASAAEGSAFDARNAGRVSISKGSCRTALGKATRYTLGFAQMPGTRLHFFVYSGRDYFTTQLEIQSAGPIGRMSVMSADNLAMPGQAEHRALFVPFDNDMWARFNAAPFSNAVFNSSEVSAFYNPVSQEGMVIGSLEQDRWKSGVGFKSGNGNKAAAVSLFAGFSDSTVTHDVIPHGRILPVKGIVCSPVFMIGRFNDWRAGMEDFAFAAARLQPRVIFNWDKPTPIGWNSWGVIKEKLKWEQVKGVVEYIADSLQAYRMKDNSLFIDLDAFWDNMTPGGIGGDVSKLKEFVNLCRSKGFRPGIYWTPFADWGKWDNKVEGTGYTYAQTWTKQNGRMLDIDGGRAMDPTHPATRQRIVYVISKMKELGFEMIKIDFLGHGAIEADRFYDPAVTSGMQAYTSGMAFLDSVLGKQMLVYAAISPTMATARFVHMRRIACDAWSSIDNTEYTLNSTGYGWWQSGMYNFMDADHVVFATEQEGVNRARLASALVTGSLVTGDDYSADGQWRGTARKLLQDPQLLRITADGKSFRPVIARTGDRGVEVFYKQSGKDTWLAVFNFSGETKQVNLPVGLLPAGGPVSATELFGNTQASLRTDAPLPVPARDVRLFHFSTKSI